MKRRVVRTRSWDGHLTKLLGLRRARMPSLFSLFATASAVRAPSVEREQQEWLQLQRQAQEAALKARSVRVDGVLLLSQCILTIFVVSLGGGVTFNRGYLLALLVLLTLTAPSLLLDTTSAKAWKRHSLYSPGTSGSFGFMALLVTLLGRLLWLYASVRAHELAAFGLLYYALGLARVRHRLSLSFVGMIALRLLLPLVGDAALVGVANASVVLNDTGLDTAGTSGIRFPTPLQPVLMPPPTPSPPPPLPHPPPPPPRPPSALSRCSHACAAVVIGSPRPTLLPPLLHAALDIAADSPRHVRSASSAAGSAWTAIIELLGPQGSFARDAWFLVRSAGAIGAVPLSDSLSRCRLNPHLP